jgi:hypothetical protein
VTSLTTAKSGVVRAGGAHEQGEGGLALLLGPGAFGEFEVEVGRLPSPTTQEADAYPRAAAGDEVID